MNAKEYLRQKHGIKHVGHLDLYTNDVCEYMESYHQEKMKEVKEKIDCLIGYCKLFTELNKYPDELPAVIEEAEEWIKDFNPAE